MRLNKMKLLLFALALSTIFTLSACGAEEKAEDANSNKTEETREEANADAENKTSSESEDSPIALGYDVGAFETVDINGDIITSEFFKDKKLTMINVMSTG